MELKEAEIGERDVGGFSFSYYFCSSLHYVGACSC